MICPIVLIRRKRRSRHRTFPRSPGRSPGRNRNQNHCRNRVGDPGVTTPNVKNRTVRRRCTNPSPLWSQSQCVFASQKAAIWVQTGDRSRLLRNSMLGHSSSLAKLFDPNAHMPRINRGMIYLGACLIAGIRLAREKQVNVRVIPMSNSIDESVDLAHEIYNRVFRKVPDRIAQK